MENHDRRCLFQTGHLREVVVPLVVIVVVLVLVLIVVVVLVVV